MRFTLSCEVMSTPGLQVPLSQWGRNAGDDRHGDPYHNEQFNGRRFERHRDYRSTGRQNYYQSRGDQYSQNDRMFTNSMYLPSDNPPYPNPYNTRRQDTGFVNPSFYSDQDDVYASFVEPDYDDNSEDDNQKATTPEQAPNPPATKTATSPFDKTFAKAAASAAAKGKTETATATEAPKKKKRPPRWDVFGETDTDDSTNQSEKHAWKIINVVMRIVVAIIFFILIFGAAVVSRLSFLVMTYNVRPTSDNFTVTRGGQRQYNLKIASGHVDLKWVWSLVIVISAPYVFTAFMCLWRVIFKKTEPLRCGPLMAAWFIETLHSLGLCTLVFYVLPSFDPVIGCFMLLNIAFFPGLIQMFIIEPHKEPIQLVPELPTGEESSGAAQKPKRDWGPCIRVIRKILDILMVFLHLGAMLVWSCRAYVIMDDVMLATLTPVSMVLTSLSWWDNYVNGKKERVHHSSKRRGSTDSAADAAELDGDGKDDDALFKVNGDLKITNQGDEASAPQRPGFLTRLKRTIKKRRTKIKLLTSLWKIAFTIAYPAVAFGYGSENCVKTFFFFYKESDRLLYYNSTGFNNVTGLISAILQPQMTSANASLLTIVSQPAAQNCSLFTSLDFVDEMTCHQYYPLLLAAVNIGCSILCYKVAKSACKVLLQIPCFVIPLSLVTPITLILLIASYVDPDDFFTVLGCRLPWVDIGLDAPGIGGFLRDFTVVYWVPAGFAAYLSLLYIAGHVWNPRAERMSRTDKLFSSPMYCGVLLDQSLLLNRRRDEDDPDENRLAGQWLSQVHDTKEMDLEEARSSLRKDTTPLIYICATMWHESETEMIMMLKSVFRLDVDQSARKNAQLYFNIIDPDYYEFEAHIFFDDAYQGHVDDNFEYTVNDFVKQLVRVMDAAASAVHNIEMKIPKPKKIPTPYGGRLVWRLPGGNTITAHLKDKAKIRHRKRWSQVMYMYYFLGYKLISQERIPLHRKKLRAENTFLLALDGDVDFQPDAVQILVDRMKQTPELGAACGRIHPIGSGPMVWYQKFEYAVSHWLQKSTEHILGCVLCSPGCFSLFRGSALMDDNVMKRYTTPPTEARHYVQYDQGEDRWLCTLLLQQGYRVEYCAASDSYTFAPEGFYEFYNQRRRWTPSTMANIIDLLGDWQNTTKNNQDISVLYIIYQLFLLGSGIITPGTIFLLIVGAISSATQDAIPLWTGLLINAIPIFIFVILCFKADSSTQLAFAGVLSIFYTIVMMLVLVGIIRGAAENGFCSVSTTFLLGVVGVFVVTALLHPMEATAILHGFLYFVSIPSMSMLLLLYSLANLHNVSWGTREVKSAAPPPPNNQPQAPQPKAQGSNFIREALSKLADTQNADSDYAFSFGNLFRCLCCPREGANPNDLKFSTIMKSIEVLDAKVSEMSMTSGVGDSLRGLEDLPEDTPPASPQHFSAVPELFEGAQEKVNPVYEKPTRDDLRNPKWSEDTDLGNGAKNFIDEDEVDFWKTFIGQYLFPLDKDEKHEKKVQAELLELRNKVSLAFLLINTLFVVLISSLQIISESTTNLSVEIPCGRNTTFTGEKIEPISVTFTLVFGVMLTCQFLAMLFHRYSTMLHIISITEIKFKKLTRHMLGMAAPEEEQPTVEETINLAREMQAIRPETPTTVESEPEADYDAEEDVSTPAGTQRKKSGSELWNKLGARGRRVQREVTLSRAFMRNFEKLAHQIRNDSQSESPPAAGAPSSRQQQLEAATNLKNNFKHLERKSLSTMVKLAQGPQYKEHILKRSREARRHWNRAFAKLRGGKFQFMNLVEEAKDRKEEEAEEMEKKRAAAEEASRGAGGGLHLHHPQNRPPPSPSLLRSESRRRPDGRTGNNLDPSSPHQDYPRYGRSPSPVMRGNRGQVRRGDPNSHSGYSDVFDEVF